jgi:hypothetical protein
VCAGAVTSFTGTGVSGNVDGVKGTGQTTGIYAGGVDSSDNYFFAEYASSIPVSFVRKCDVAGECLCFCCVLVTVFVCGRNLDSLRGQHCWRSSR